MALQSLNPLLEKAEKENYAVGAFNINNDIQAEAIMKAGSDHNSPLIIQASKGACVFQGWPSDKKNPTLEELFNGALRIKRLAEMASEPYPRIDYVLHLDHGPNPEFAKMCIEAGFSSVMIDGSTGKDGNPTNLEDNIRITKEVVDFARDFGKKNKKYISVEGELGTLGGMSHAGGTDKIFYTQPEEVVKFTKETGVDALAIAWGTRHGPNKAAGGKIDLRPEVIKNCYNALKDEGLNCYLVSHGSSTVPQKYVEEINQYGGALNSSGIPDKVILQAIENGARKINIDTNLRLGMTAKVRNVLANKPATIDPRDYLTPARDEMYNAVADCLKLFKSVDKN